jgi:hypothetical protein
LLPSREPKPSTSRGVLACFGSRSVRASLGRRQSGQAIQLPSMARVDVCRLRAGQKWHGHDPGGNLFPISPLNPSDPHWARQQSTATASRQKRSEPLSWPADLQPALACRLVLNYAAYFTTLKPRPKHFEGVLAREVIEVICRVAMVKSDSRALATRERRVQSRSSLAHFFASASR